MKQHSKNIKVMLHIIYNSESKLIYSAQMTTTDNDYHCMYNHHVTSKIALISN